MFKVQSSKFKVSIMGYLISVVGLFLYSFTQIDLGLTLSQVSIWQTAVKFFKNIGYFQRPLSSLFFVGIVLLLFIFYLFILNAIHKKKVSKKNVWFLIIAAAVILTFSYNAFSYDVFNYIFDAKIVTYYHENPYLHKALDYTGDPMLSFMRWTHRVYPYGPVWLGITVPLSFLGMGFFLPTFFLFKILSLVFYCLSVIFLFRLARIIKKEKALFITALFALNPLV